MDPEEEPFTAKQAEAILELQLHRLTRLSIDEISKELAETRDRITEYQSILGSEKKLRTVIVKELEEVKKLYGDVRRTTIEDEAAEILLEDLIADEQVAVTVEPTPRLSISERRSRPTASNAAAETGRTGMKTRDEEFCLSICFIASTHAFILDLYQYRACFLAQGVYEVPDVGAAGKGPNNIGNLVGLLAGESVRAFLPVRNLEEEGKVRVLCHPQRNGKEDRTEGLLSRDASVGIIAIGIDTDDELVCRVADRRQADYLPGVT